VKQNVVAKMPPFVSVRAECEAPADSVVGQKIERTIVRSCIRAVGSAAAHVCARSVAKRPHREVISRAFA